MSPCHVICLDIHPHEVYKSYGGAPPRKSRPSKQDENGGDTSNVDGPDRKRSSSPGKKKKKTPKNQKKIIEKKRNIFIFIF